MSVQILDYKSKHAAIKKRLLQGLPITGRQAMISYNVYRLSSVIHRLRNEGLNIKTNMKGNYATYYIPKKSVNVHNHVTGKDEVESILMSNVVYTKPNSEKG